jgi:transposase
MEYLHFIGIDVSKKTLALQLRDSHEELQFDEINNKPTSIKKWIKSLKSFKLDPSKTLVCLEYTGVYSQHALTTFYDQGFCVWIEHALHIKHSIGMTRGKNDKVDASRIAVYAFRYQDKVQPWEPEREVIKKLKKLFCIRESLLKSKKQLGLSMKQSKGFESKDLTKTGEQLIKPLLNKLKQQIAKVNQQLRELIQQDERLKALTEITKSVPGIGEVVSWKLLSVTNEFKSFSDGKKFACYAGVVPFSYRSGTSIKGKSRVSHMANKEIKSLLHLSAIACISRGKGELFEYFERKVAAGKNKMSVVNAMKNKIILRVFACIRNNRKYENFYVNSLA